MSIQENQSYSCAIRVSRNMELRPDYMDHVKYEVSRVLGEQVIDALMESKKPMVFKMRKHKYDLLAETEHVFSLDVGIVQVMEVRYVETQEMAQIPVYQYHDLSLFQDLKRRFWNKSKTQVWLKQQKRLWDETPDRYIPSR